MEKQRLGLECKRYMAKAMKGQFGQSPHIFITNLTALSVPDQEELRGKLREQNASMFVVKNRIAKNVFKELGIESMNSLLKGMTAVALGGEEAVNISKTLVSFAEKNESFSILGAYCFEQVLDSNSVKKLASIPSKETLIAQVLRGFQSPVQGFVTTLSATLKGFVVVLNKISEKKQ
ncbi:MAG: 50S ribosomal protein L10 [Candidatus Omnitrophica bacterium]|nr:50S ribosomal protein L10 [Candidatus Omnitrophota bacterium]